MPTEQRIFLDFRNYEGYGILENNLEKESQCLMDAMDIINILTKNNYECLVTREAGVGLEIKFAHDPGSENWGSERYVLCTEGEEDFILQKRLENNLI